MQPKLRLTARGHAVCELMSNQGVTLEAACARVELELEILRQTVANILAETPWAGVPGALQAALERVSPRLQEAYLEEAARAGSDAPPARAAWHEGANIH